MADNTNQEPTNEEDGVQEVTPLDLGAFVLGVQEAVKGTDAESDFDVIAALLSVQAQLLAQFGLAAIPALTDSGDVVVLVGQQQ